MHFCIFPSFFGSFQAFPILKTGFKSNRFRCKDRWFSMAGKQIIRIQRSNVIRGKQYGSVERIMGQIKWRPGFFIIRLIIRQTFSFIWWWMSMRYRNFLPGYKHTIILSDIFFRCHHCFQRSGFPSRDLRINGECGWGWSRMIFGRRMITGFLFT